MYTIQRVNCTKHPSEQLNNFCSNTNCKIALCASCIGEHTHNHLKQGTNPIYSNIKEVLMELNKQLERYLQDARETLARITGIMQKIQSKELTLRQLMKSIRNEANQLLNNRLNALEQQLMNQINNQTQKSSIHNFSKMQSLVQKVKKEKNIYMQCLQQIKKPEIAHNLKIISQDVLYQSSQKMLDIKQQVDKNQQVQTGFIYNQDKLKENIIKGVQGLVIYFKNQPSKPDTSKTIQKTEIEKKKQSKLQINTSVNFNKLNSPPKYVSPNKTQNYQNLSYQPNGNLSVRESMAYNLKSSDVSISISPNNRRPYMTSFNFYNQSSNQNHNNKFLKQSFNRTISGASSTKGSFRPFGNRNQ